MARPEEVKREKWQRKMDYLLVMLGSSVGFGNVWRFPYVCARNGGGAFLIPYLILLFLGGIPIYFLEMAVGQFSGKSFIHIYEVCPIFKGIGYCQFIILFLGNSQYIVLLMWTVYYLAFSFVQPLPWSTCENEWNSPNCISDRVAWRLFNSSTRELLPNSSYPIVTAGMNNETFITSLEDFWQFKVLKMSLGIDEIGTINVPLLLCLLASWCLVCLCIIRGVHSVGKVVYVTVTLPYVLLITLLLRSVVLDGAVDGIVQFLKPDFNKLLDYQIWIEAAIQVTFSIDACWGTVITLSSLNKFHNNCLRDSVLISIVGECTTLLAGLTVFSTLGFMAKKFDLPIDSVVKSGPALAFMVYPEALLQLPAQNIWAVLFFLLLLTIGLDTVFAHVEGFVTCMSDCFPILQKRKTYFIISYCFINFLLGIIFCTEGGIYVFQIYDWYIGAFSLLLIGFLNCLIFGWIYGIENLSRDIKLMIGRDMPLLVRISLKFITPSVYLVLFITTITLYEPPTYGDYTYPKPAIVVGLIIAGVPLVPIIVVPVIAILKAPQNTLIKKIKILIKSSDQWLPADRQYRGLFTHAEELDTIS